MAVNWMQYGAIPFAFPGLPHIRCAFTTRAAGNLAFSAAGNDQEKEATLAARQALFDELGFESWSETRQVHGDDFVSHAEPTPVGDGELPEADGQATDRKNHALCVKTADCQPILLAHPSGCVAAVHAGWRGNVLQFPESAVSGFCSAYSLDPAEVRAVRGPSLGYAEFTNFTREWPVSFAPWFNQSTRCMDLWSLTRRQLSLAGIKPGNIYGIDLCTYSLNGHFFSHRRGDSSRQMALIWSTCP